MEAHGKPSSYGGRHSVSLDCLTNHILSKSGTISFKEEIKSVPESLNKSMKIILCVLNFVCSAGGCGFLKRLVLKLKVSCLNRF